MSQGWICVHRKLLDWEWFEDHNTFRLFVYLMLKANHKDNKWKGIVIKRGQHLTSLDALCVGTGLTKSKIRTSLKKLKSTGDIAHETNNQHTVITMINYNLYQDVDTQINKQIANKSQTNDNQIATNNNVNKENNGNNDKDIVADAPAFNFKNELLALGVDKDILEDWLTVRKKKKASNTKTALKGLITEITKSGLMINDAIEYAVKNSWSGFKATWYFNDNQQTGPKQYSEQTAQNIKNLEGGW